MKYLQQTNICRNTATGDKLVLHATITTSPIENISSQYRHNPLLVVLLTQKGKEKFAQGCAKNDCYKRENIEIYGKVKTISGIFDQSDTLLHFQEATQKNDLKQAHLRTTSVDGFIRRVQSLINSMTCKITLIEEEIVIDQASVHSVFSPTHELQRGVHIFREKVVDLFYNYLPNQHAGLAAGVLIGVKSRLDQDFYEQLVATGTLHVISASGYNISVVVAVVMLLLKKFLNKRLSVLLAVFFIFLYVLLAGGSPAVVRAGIMGVISSLGIVTGRVYSAKWALFFSSILMLIYSPLFLLDISFQLSVSATAGILWLYPLIKEFQESIFHDRKKLVYFQDFIDAFCTTVGASMMTLPIILIHFGRVSLIAFVANTFGLWLVPYIMLFSAMFVFGGLVHPYLATTFSFLVWSSTEIFIQIIQFFSIFPFAQIEVTHSQWILGLGVYTLIGYVLLRYRKKAKT